MYLHNAIFYFPRLDLSLQESLYSEYKKSCPSLQAVRVAHSGRSGRHAVIYFGSMGDAKKALDETRLNANGGAVSSSAASLFEGTESHVFLADDEVVDDK